MPLKIPDEALAILRAYDDSTTDVSAEKAERAARVKVTEMPRRGGLAGVGAEVTDSPIHDVHRWPDPLTDEAYHGLAGDWVRTVEPHTEADPVALLIQLLVAFGNLIGRKPYYTAEADRHYTNLFAVIVGQTAKGRKGTSLGQVLRAFNGIDEDWCKRRTMGGLSSGEGLIWAVRDEILENVAIREKGQPVRNEEQLTDKGEADKRLMVTESELASVLQRADRETNTLSAIIRQCWDSGNLNVLTKKQSAHATDAHISIIGHITRDLARGLSWPERG